MTTVRPVEPELRDLEHGAAPGRRRRRRPAGPPAARPHRSRARLLRPRPRHGRAGHGGSRTPRTWRRRSRRASPRQARPSSRWSSRSSTAFVPAAVNRRDNGRTTGALRQTSNAARQPRNRSQGPRSGMPFARPPGEVVQKSGSPTDTSQSLTEQRRLLLATVKRPRRTGGRCLAEQRRLLLATAKRLRRSGPRRPCPQESAKSTTTGAWSDGFCPFRASRSLNASGRASARGRRSRERGRCAARVPGGSPRPGSPTR